MSRRTTGPATTAGSSTAGTPTTERAPARRRTARQPRLRLAESLLLRAWDQDDAPGLVIAGADPLVVRYAGLTVPDRDRALTLIHEYGAAWAEGDGVAWALADDGGTVLGGVHFRLVDPELGVGAVGYWLCAQARGQGLASRSLAAGTDAVFARLGWHRIELRHEVGNERSCAVARRCGFRLEGLLRESTRVPATVSASPGPQGPATTGAPRAAVTPPSGRPQPLDRTGDGHTSDTGACTDQTRRDEHLHARLVCDPAPRGRR